MNETIVYGIIFIYGIFIGSFLNVCIFRIPGEESIVAGRSHCMSCNSRIKWYDLIPVFSYIILLGRCRKCKAKISIQYPIIEALNGLFYVLVFYINGYASLKDIMLSGLYCFVISALIVLSMIDFRTKTIPTGINIFIAVIGIFIVVVKYIWFGRDFGIVLEHIIGFFAVSVFLLIILYATHGKGIGGGDIRLMAAAGLVLGWKLILLAFIIGCILGSVIHLIRMKISRLDSELAFGPYLSAGIAIALLYGREIVDWYVRVFFI